MRRLKTLTTQYNYNDIDRQLKEKFIHGPNDNGMMAEITRKFTKGENKNVMPNPGSSLGKVSTGPKNTNSSSEWLKGIPKILCKTIAKHKNTSRNYNRTKQA